MAQVVLRPVPLVSIVMAFLATLVIGGYSGGGSVVGAAPSDGGNVEIVNFEFMPQVARVAAGTTVEWTNRDTSTHSVKDQSSMSAPESPSLAEGETFTITYEKPGTYPYICGIHNYMTGTVEVA